MTKLRIDPEFRDKIPPLTESEFEQLRENILSDGEVYEPIVTWNGVIVDGHNRWRIIQENPQIPFRTKEMDFADKWAAFEWMYRKQLGRRNLTEQQKAYMIGKMYEARKNTQGGDRRSEEFSNGQNVHLKERREVKDGTSGEIGKEFGVDGKTVRRNEKFAKGVDALREQNAEAAEVVLSGGSGISKEVVSEIPFMPKEVIAEVAQDIVTGEIKKKRREGNWANKETREQYNKIDQIAHQVGNEVIKTTFDDVMRLLDIIEDDFIAKVERIIEGERAKLSADERWPDAIDGYFDGVIADIENMKRRILK